MNTVGRPNFEACYKAVMSKECDYACVPVENSLGGSIHENYDLMLRYVNHCDNNGMCLHIGHSFCQRRFWAEYSSSNF